MLGLLLSLTLVASAADFSVEPPPGWRDVSAEKGGPGVLAALRGPETSSFVLSRIGPLGLENRGVVRAYLLDVLTEVNKRAGLVFVPEAGLSAETYGNGMNALSLRASYDGRPRLVLSVMECGGQTLLSTMVSSIPDTLLPSILGSLRAVGQTSVEAGRARSLDGQFVVDVPAGAGVRPLAEREIKAGVVLAIDGLGSEVLLQKQPVARVPLEERAAGVRRALLDAGVSGVAPFSIVPTKAGPRAIAAAGAGGAAAYLPWCYWGYSALARGPQAAELLRRVLTGLGAGPSALPGLLARTPEAPIPPQWRDWAFAPAAILLFLAVLIAARTLRRRS